MNKDSNKEIMDMLSSKLNTSGEEIESCAKSGNVDSLLGKLPAWQQEKVKRILDNPEETKKLLSNPQVQTLLRKLQGNG